jgi:hypothetical protein
LGEDIRRAKGVASKVRSRNAPRQPRERSKAVAAVGSRACLDCVANVQSGVL